MIYFISWAFLSHSEHLSGNFFPISNPEKHSRNFRQKTTAFQKIQV